LFEKDGENLLDKLMGTAKKISCGNTWIQEGILNYPANGNSRCPSGNGCLWDSFTSGT
jgi:hypothetical protein